MRYRNSMKILTQPLENKIDALWLSLMSPQVQWAGFHRKIKHKLVF